MAEEKSEEQSEKEKSSLQESKLAEVDVIPETITIDMTPELYQTIKSNLVKQQHPVVRPYLGQFLKWLKSLDPLDVYDALESGQTVKDKYDEMRFNPIRITAAAARGLLKSSSQLRVKANKAFSLDVARLVLRFENPEVNNVLKLFDKEERFLTRNIDATKEILGLIGGEEEQ